jgi:hypothetical protein
MADKGSVLPGLAAVIGKGLVAGAVGTAAMTVSSTVEMKLRGRKPSDAPARAASKVLGLEPIGEAEWRRFSTVVHWAYGTLWGSVRGLLAALDVPGTPAVTVHLAAVWGFELMMLPTLGVTPPATQWGWTEVVIDAWHHSVYAGVTNLAYVTLDRKASE